MKTTFFIFFVLFLFTTSAQEKIIWDYPVKPGTEQWAAFTTGEQMVNACQIPQEILSNLSTKELAAICLNYPLYSDYMVTNDERMAVNYMLEQFNGFKELSKRKDGTKELIEIYKDYPVSLQKQKSMKGLVNYSLLKLPFLELLIADESFISQLNDSGLVELKEIVLQKYVEKLENSDDYGLRGIKKTLLLGAITLDRQRVSSETKQSTIKKYIQDFDHAESSLITEISKIISGK